VFHDVPIGERGANIDHLVVSPAGVFTLNTKNRHGKVSVSAHTFRVDGYRTDYLPKAAREAERVSRDLGAALGRPVTVHGVLVVIADELDVSEQPADVHVGSPRGIKRWLERLPQTLSRCEVTEIAAAAHKPATWSERLGRCPCGGTMVRRTRRADGAPFLGCSRFPKCRRTWPVAAQSSTSTIGTGSPSG
jgi:Nuclease-related domain/Topoisomerase DNA binding C4 zinc finger